MQFKYEKPEDGDTLHLLTKTLMFEITNAKEEYIRKSIIDYARKQQEYLGTEIELYLMDEEIAKKIIELGVSEYIKQLDPCES